VHHAIPCTHTTPLPTDITTDRTRHPLTLIPRLVQCVAPAPRQPCAHLSAAPLRVSHCTRQSHSPRVALTRAPHSCRDCTLNPDRSMARCAAPEEPFGPRSFEGDEGELPFRYGMDSLFHVFQHLALRELCMVHCVCKVRVPFAAAAVSSNGVLPVALPLSIIHLMCHLCTVYRVPTSRRGDALLHTRSCGRWCGSAPTLPQDCGRRSSPAWPPPARLRGTFVV
jgi:hypothetical protein